jgi:COP9 signalosome complex subunit 2
VHPLLIYPLANDILIVLIENWKEAQSDFFEAFRAYDEAGSLQRIQVLKYLVLTTLLTKSDINPFDSQEIKPYKNDPRISAMTDLVDAYQRDDIHKYESVLQNNKDLLEDSFIAENIDEVTRNMRTKAVSKLIAPYTRFSLEFVGQKLKISVAEVQDIISFLIVDKKLKGTIDQAKGTVEVDVGSDEDRTLALQEWTNALRSLWVTVLNESEGFRSDDFSQMLGGTVNPVFPSMDIDGPQGTSRMPNGFGIPGRGRGAPKRHGGRARNPLARLGEQH